MYLCMYIANNRHEVLDHPSIHPSTTYRVFYGLYAKITTSEWLIARATTKSTRESQYAPPREKSFVTIRFVPSHIYISLSIAVHLLIIKLHLQVLVVVVVNWRCSFLETHLLSTYLCTLTQFVVNIRHELQDQAGVVSFNPHYQRKGFPPVADVGSVCVCVRVCVYDDDDSPSSSCRDFGTNFDYYYFITIIVLAIASISITALDRNWTALLPLPLCVTSLIFSWIMHRLAATTCFYVWNYAYKYLQFHSFRCWIYFV